MDIQVNNVKIEFNPRPIKGDYFYKEPVTGHGFYPNLPEFTEVWGRPYKKNCIEIAESYINSNIYRAKALQTYK